MGIWSDTHTITEAYFHRTWFQSLVLIVIVRIDAALAALLEHTVDTVVLDSGQGAGVTAFALRRCCIGAGGVLRPQRIGQAQRVHIHPLDRPGRTQEFAATKIYETSSNLVVLCPTEHERVQSY